MSSIASTGNDVSTDDPYHRQTIKLAVGTLGVTPCLVKNIFRNVRAQAAILVYLKRQMQ